jgi:hypothetical protein
MESPMSVIEQVESIIAAQDSGQTWRIGDVEFEWDHQFEDWRWSQAGEPQGHDGLYKILRQCSLREVREFFVNHY